MAMYMQPEPFEQAHTGMRIGRLGGAVVAVSVAGLLVLGIRPNRLLDLAKTSGDGLRPVPAVTTPAPPSTRRRRPEPPMKLPPAIFREYDIPGTLGDQL